MLGQIEHRKLRKTPEPEGKRILCVSKKRRTICSQLVQTEFSSLSWIESFLDPFRIIYSVYER